MNASQKVMPVVMRSTLRSGARGHTGWEFDADSEISLFTACRPAVDGAAWTRHAASESVSDASSKPMWRTQTGDRVLTGAEARLIRTALAVLVDQIEMEIEGISELSDFEVPIFDRLQSRQKLALLADVGHHLLCSTGPPPQLTATNESAVAVLYKVIEEWVEMEIDNEEEIREMPGEDPFAWRRNLRDAYRECIPDDPETPAETSRDVAEWGILIECLETRVLWDADYLDEDVYADQAPETGKILKDELGVADDYFTAVAPDPTDRDLEIVRQKIRGLIDG